jgi:uncharacterized membrane protein
MFALGQYMICPRCQKEMPDDQKGKRCPFCGSPATRVNWWLFLGALLLPPVLTLLSAVMMRLILSDPMAGGVSLIVGLVGSVVVGIFCSVTLVRGLTGNKGSRVAGLILFAPIMILVCLTLCLFGCAFGGGL